jgi:hypothetical protein
MADLILHAIVKRLYRWFRSRSRPHGAMEHTYRGVRLAYNSSYRLSVCLVSLILFLPGAALFFTPGSFNEPPLIDLALKIACAGILLVLVLAPLQAVRDFLIVNDEGLMKSDLFGRRTNLKWNAISQVQIDFDGIDITFRSDAGKKVKASRAYDGWQDFLKTSARHLDRRLQAQLAFALEDQMKRTANYVSNRN